MSHRHERDEQKERQWRRWVREWRSSGLSVRAFCGGRGLTEANFYAWRRALARRDAESATFVPVQVVSEETPTKDQPLELVLAGGRSVRIACGFDAATLRQLLAVLEDQPC